MLSLLVFIVCVGLVLWVCTLLPLDAQIQGIIRVVAIVIIVIAILQTILGIAGYGFPYIH